MYTVMLVDDEHLLRAGLRKHVPWERCGFEVTLEASTGMEALSLLKRHRVDLIMLDIKMPGMSGFEMLDALSRSGLDAHVVILSGYGEFEFARQALKYTVVDYLLKPVKVQEVTELLQSIRAKLEQKQADSVQSESQRRQILEVDLFKLLNGPDDGRKAASFAESLYCTHPQATFRMAFAAVAVDGIGEHAKTALSRHFTGAMADAGLLIAEEHGFGYGLLFIMDGEQASEEEWQQLVMSLPSSCPEVRAGVFGASFRQSAGAVPFAADFHARLKRLLFYSRYPFEIERHAAYVPEQAPQRFEWSAAERDEWRAVLLSRNPEDVRLLLFGWCRRLQEERGFTIESVKEAGGQLLRSAYELREERSGISPMLHSAASEAEASVQELHRAVRLQELHDRLVLRLTSMFAQSGEPVKETKRRIILELQQYVHEHLADPVSLTDIAVRFGVTHEYLSTLFKREEKVNFLQYLKQARINRAMDIMKRDPRQKIYEVAYQVGYTDAKHFSKVFRECTGLTPKEFFEKVHE